MNLANPNTGERYVFLENSDDGALRWDTYISEPGAGTPSHLHPYQEERFWVRSGKLGARVDGQESTVSEGGELTVPAGSSHRIWNAGEGELQATAELSQQGGWRFREFLKASTALGGGFSGALEGARLLHEYRDVMRPASPPEPLRSLLFPLLAVLARMLDRAKRTWR